MGKPVNLNRFRKQKARAEKTARADQNAALHGLSKAERELAQAQNKLSTLKHNGAKRDEDN
ncbi:MAG: DUF4169 family protein [Planktotalea sp.]|uniref:DUF4169 family protein n=1 Tax=Planktotalea sp. TaxID=2029877 RepID=UPI003C732F3E